jgi:hypothetical protein
VKKLNINELAKKEAALMQKLQRAKSPNYANHISAALSRVSNKLDMMMFNQGIELMGVVAQYPRESDDAYIARLLEMSKIGQIREAARA